MPTDRPAASGTGVTLRPATPSDASSLAALSIEVWIGTYLRHGVNGFFADYALAEFTAAKLARLLADPAQSFTVSQNEDGIDGFIRLSLGHPAPAGIASPTEIATLYVQPRHHGKGIGRALLAGGLDIARASGAPSVWLAVNSENTAAIGFYLSQGFQNMGRTHFRIGAQQYPNEVLVYRLSR
jgi:ribosomal protein S18 acetylase RimI-like enzyme